MEVLCPVTEYLEAAEYLSSNSQKKMNRVAALFKSVAELQVLEVLESSSPEAMVFAIDLALTELSF